MYKRVTTKHTKDEKIYNAEMDISWCVIVGKYTCKRFVYYNEDGDEIDLPTKQVDQQTMSALYNDSSSFLRLVSSDTE